MTRVKYEFKEIDKHTRYDKLTTKTNDGTIHSRSRELSGVNIVVIIYQEDDVYTITSETINNVTKVRLDTNNYISDKRSEYGYEYNNVTKCNINGKILRTLTIGGINYRQIHDKGVINYRKDNNIYRYTLDGTVTK